MNRLSFSVFLGFLFAVIAPVFCFSASKFKDVPEGHWAEKSIDNLVDMKIVDGYEDGTFRGRKTITRYELALYLANVTKYLEQKNETKILQLQAEIDELKRKATN